MLSFPASAQATRYGILDASIECASNFNARRPVRSAYRQFDGVKPGAGWLRRMVSSTLYASPGYIQNRGAAADAVDAGGTVGKGMSRSGQMLGLRHSF